jgi:hypothetical protein
MKDEQSRLTAETYKGRRQQNPQKIHTLRNRHVHSALRTGSVLKELLFVLHK